MNKFLKGYGKPIYIFIVNISYPVMSVLKLEILFSEYDLCKIIFKNLILVSIKNAKSHGKILEILKVLLYLIYHCPHTEI